MEVVEKALRDLFASDRDPSTGIDVPRSCGLDQATVARAYIRGHAEVKYAPPLRNPLKPFTGPDPKITIPFSEFPHILENIINLADKNALLQLRATSKKVAELVDREFAVSLHVTDIMGALRITSNDLGIIPALRFVGLINLAVGLSPRDFAAHNMFAGPTNDGFPTPIDTWLRVLPKSVPALNKFMKHVTHVDCHGHFNASLSPGTRAMERGRDPIGNVNIDRFSAKSIRLFPDEEGGYSNLAPFTAPILEHTWFLPEQNAPWPDFWLTTRLPIPDGNIAYGLGIELCSPSSFGGHAVQSAVVPFDYPPSVRTVTVSFDLASPAPQSLSTLQALTSALLKIFRNFRFDGTMICIIAGISRWDHLPNNNARQHITSLAALCHLAAQRRLGVPSGEVTSPRALYFLP